MLLKIIIDCFLIDVDFYRFAKVDSGMQQHHPESGTQVIIDG